MKWSTRKYVDRKYLLYSTKFVLKKKWCQCIYIHIYIRVCVCVCVSSTSFIFFPFSLSVIHIPIHCLSFSHSVCLTFSLSVCLTVYFYIYGSLKGYQYNLLYSGLYQPDSLRKYLSIFISIDQSIVQLVRHNIHLKKFYCLVFKR